jgi:hypothetical protein
MLRGRLLSVPFVRALGTREVGFVRTIAPTELVVARTSVEALDIGDTLAVSTSAGQGPPVMVHVLALTGRDARVAQVATDRDEGVRHGDPVEFIATERAHSDR